LGTGEFGGLALGALFFERFDALAIGLIKRDCVLAGEQVIAGVAGADADLIAFATEAGDGFQEEDFMVSHGSGWVVLVKK
jgi:hypothetical protein